MDDALHIFDRTVKEGRIDVVYVGNNLESHIFWLFLEEHKGPSQEDRNNAVNVGKIRVILFQTLLT